MAIFIMRHTLTGKDAKYMQDKLALILGAIPIKSGAAYRADSNIDTLFIDPTLKVGLPRVVPLIDNTVVPSIRYVEYSKKNGQVVLLRYFGNGVSCWDDRIWIFVVDDAAAVTVNSLITTINEIA